MKTKNWLYFMLLIVSIPTKLAAQGDAFSYSYPFTFVDIDTSHHHLTSDEAVSTVLDLNNNHAISLVDSDIDEVDNMINQHYEHFFKGVKIDKVRTSTHNESGKHTHLTSNYSPIPDSFVVTPSISEPEALAYAVSYTGNHSFIWDTDTTVAVPEGQLAVVTFIGDIDTLLLAYKYDFSADTTFYGDQIVYVDALSGKFIKSNNLWHTGGATGTLETLNYGIQRATIDFNTAQGAYATMKLGTPVIGLYGERVPYTSSSTIFTSSNDQIKGGYQVFWGLQKLMPFLAASPFKWKSWDNGNSAVILHNETEMTQLDAMFSNNDVASTEMNNAWNIFYGKATSSYSLALVAHEFFHGVTHKRSSDRDVRLSEANALEESMSDIFGAIFGHFMVENGHLNDYWHLGEGLLGDRQIDDPKSLSCATTVKGDHWTKFSDLQNDFQLFRNTTPISYWFYLLTEGKKDINDNKSSFEVQGIGWEKSVVIWWNAYKYIKNNSGYFDFATFTKNAAKKKYGKTSNAYYQTLNAWYAVGLRKTPPEAPTNLEVKADGSINTRRLFSADMVSGLYGAFNKRISLKWDESVTFDNKAIEQYWIVDNGELLGSTTETSFDFSTYEAKHEIKVIAEDSDGELSDPLIVTIEDVFNMQSNSSSYVAPIVSLSLITIAGGGILVFNKKRQRIRELQTKGENNVLTNEEAEELQGLLNDNSGKCE